jgi:hypothetical protein
MSEGAAEGQPKQHKAETKNATEAQHTIDSPATPRQLPTESDQSREARQARINDLGKRIQQSVQEAENTLADARSFGEVSPQTPSKNKEQKKTGIRGLISRGVEKVKGVIGKSKSTETPSRK